MMTDETLLAQTVEVLERVLRDVGIGDGLPAGGIAASAKSSSSDLVSSLDLDIETALRDALPALLPGSRVLGEEFGGEVGGPTWVVDPIDGTTNVVHGLPYAACSVALLDERTPRLAVVRNLGDSSTFVASRHGGAYELRGGEPIRLAVSKTTSLSAALLGFGVPYDRSKGAELFRVAQHLYAQTQDVRRMGSAALDVIGVAQGRLDAFFELDLRVWDIAGSSLILEEAGGRLTDWTGQELRWSDPMQKLKVVASNAHLADAMVEAIAASAPVSP